MAQRRLWGFLGKGKRFLYFQPTSPSSFSCVLVLFSFIATIHLYYFFFCNCTLFKFHPVDFKIFFFSNLHSTINSFTKQIFNKYSQLQEMHLLSTLLGRLLHLLLHAVIQSAMQCIKSCRYRFVICLHQTSE